VREIITSRTLKGESLYFLKKKSFYNRKNTYFPKIGHKMTKKRLFWACVWTRNKVPNSPLFPHEIVQKGRFLPFLRPFLGPKSPEKVGTNFARYASRISKLEWNSCRETLILRVNRKTRLFLGIFPTLNFKKRHFSENVKNGGFWRIGINPIFWGISKFHE
jgi:hypothetical protein